MNKKRPAKKKIEDTTTEGQPVEQPVEQLVEQPVERVWNRKVVIVVPSQLWRPLRCSQTHFGCETVWLVPRWRLVADVRLIERLSLQVH